MQPGQRRRLSSLATALQRQQQPPLSSSPAAGVALQIVELAPNHCCLSQTSADAKLIAANLPWYSAAYSPHDVPSFYDVSGLTEQPAVFQRTIDVLAARYSSLPAESACTAVAGFDARGFIFGPPLALALGVPFVMIRKAGKLPGVLVSSGEYQTEYSTDETVMRLGSVSAGDRVVLVDDLIATGGTAIAGFELVDQLGVSMHAIPTAACCAREVSDRLLVFLQASVLEFASVVTLPGLGGIEAIHSYAGGKFKDVRTPAPPTTTRFPGICLTPCLRAQVPVFTLVDDATIGPEMCCDPPAGTPRVVSASEAAVYAAGGSPAAAATATEPETAPVGASAADTPEEIARILQQPTAPKDAAGNYVVKVGIIGGSGLDDPDILKNATEVAVDTPYGPPSDSLICGEISGVSCVLLARHGRGHTIQPTDVNYRANIYALKAMGCTHLVVSTAVGILQEGIKPGELALLDQYIDRTTKRASTFYDGEANHPPGVCHIPQGQSFCQETRQTVLGVADDLGLKMHPAVRLFKLISPVFVGFSLVFH